MQGVWRHRWGQHQVLLLHGDCRKYVSIKYMPSQYRRSHSERLMEVEMANIASANRRVRQSNLCIEIGAIQVDLPTIVMNNLAGLLCAAESKSSILDRGTHTSVTPSSNTPKVDGYVICPRMNSDPSSVTRGKTLYHENRELIFVQHCLCLQVFQVQISICMCLDWDDLQTCHHS